MPMLELLEFVERIGNVLRAEQWRNGRQLGLQPVHVQVLEYLRRCNRYSDTPLVLAKYLGVTKGTLSQSLSLLERKALIQKNTDIKDRRVVHLQLTAEGCASIEKLSVKQLIRQMGDNLGGDNIQISINQLETILRKLQMLNLSLSFGVCKTCRHFMGQGEHGPVCGLTNEALTALDIEKICHEHDYPK